MAAPLCHLSSLEAIADDGTVGTVPLGTGGAITATTAAPGVPDDMVPWYGMHARITADIRSRKTLRVLLLGTPLRIPAAATIGIRSRFEDCGRVVQHKEDASDYRTHKDELEDIAIRSAAVRIMTSSHIASCLCVGSRCHGYRCLKTCIVEHSSRCFGRCGRNITQMLHHHLLHSARGRRWRRVVRRCRRIPILSHVGGSLRLRLILRRRNRSRIVRIRVDVRRAVSIPLPIAALGLACRRTCRRCTGSSGPGPRYAIHIIDDRVRSRSTSRCHCYTLSSF